MQDWGFSSAILMEYRLSPTSRVVRSQSFIIFALNLRLLLAVVYTVKYWW